MAEPVALYPNHQRSLSVTARTVEESLEGLVRLLESRGKSTLTRTIAPSFSDAERNHLLSIVQEMRRVNEEMVRALGLTADRVTEAQVVTARLTHLWTILMDSQSGSLRGFGEMAPEQAQAVDRYVGRLLKMLSQWQQW